MWLTSEECEKVIKDSWTTNANSHEVDGFWEKMENCRVGLMNWSRASFGSVKNRIMKLKEEIHSLKRGMLTADSKKREKDLCNELEQLLDQESIMWEQRAKAHWLKDGDRNTSFFHSRATVRKEKNEIKAIRNSEGNWCGSKEEIESTVVRYFQQLFSSARPTEEDISTALEAVRAKVDNQTNQTLLRAYTAKEVTHAIRSMHPLKSPGPDGLSPLFFQKAWKYIGVDVSNCVLNFLNNRSFNMNCNYTHIVLIPKIANPEFMSQFRPISLCNVIYKIASKAIVNRLKPHMNSIISEYQSAFVPSRQITDNVLVAYEITEYMRQKAKKDIRYMAIKLDMCKAYDKVEWPFIRAVMLKLGFESVFVDLIMLCITTVTYSCVLNGDRLGYIVPERGIRQGDPLSPYIFLFCAEALSSLITREEEQGNLNGVEICNGAPRVSHLLFADDTLILCKAKMNEAMCINEILKIYGRASGQDINFQKSSMVFSKNTSRDIIEGIQSVLPIRVVDRHEKYLGLPLSIGKSRKEVFDFIRQRFWEKIQGWNEKLLSRAGKEVLIKAVIQAIPSYVMSCFKLPKTLIKELESMISGFWWSDRGTRKTHWVNWKTLCTSKRVGGLGFRDLEAFNTALLAKQGWKILTKPENLLSRLLKAKYFPNVDFLEAPLGSNPSLTWRSIWGSKNLIMAGIRWRVGNGETIDIWKDPWIPRPSTFKISSPPNRLPQNSKVSALIDGELGTWNEELISTIFWPEDVPFILAIPLGSRLNQDARIWHYTKDGQFTVRSAYHLGIDLKEHGSTSTAVHKDWRWLWMLRIPPKVKIFLWRLCHNVLPTRSALEKRKIPLSDTTCPVCHVEVEDLLHVFLRCPYARQFWAISDFPFQTYNTEATNAELWLEELRVKLDKRELALFVFGCWTIWWNRNQLTWGKEGKEVAEAVTFAKDYFNRFDTLTRGNISERSSERNRVTWAPPHSPSFKINFAAFFTSVGAVVGIGGVARDANGQCISWFAEHKQGVASATVAESIAALRAMELVQQHGWDDIILEGDCRNLLTTIADPSPSLHDYGPIAEDIKRIGATLSSFNISHVLREGNSVAHCLANCASRFVDGDSINLTEVNNFVIADFY